SYTMVLIGNYADEAAMIKFLLGYSKKDTTTGKLTRIPPLQHPRVPRFWCTKVTTKPYRPRFDAASGVNQTPPFQGLVGGAGAAVYPQYDKIQYNCSFNSVQYRYLTDAQLAAAPYSGAESYRWVRITGETDLEQIQLRQGQFCFFNGTGADAYPGGDTV